MGHRLTFALALLDVGLGRRYGHTNDDTVDCIRFAYQALAAAHPDRPWAEYTKELHLNGQTPPSTVNVVTVSLLLGHPVTTAPDRGGWWYCQGWRWDASRGQHRGHTWVYLHHPQGMGWIVEATNGRADWARRIPWAELDSYWDTIACTRCDRPAWAWCDPPAE